MCTSTLFDIISSNVTKCAKNQFQQANLTGAIFLDMLTRTIAWMGVENVSIGVPPISININIK